MLSFDELYNKRRDHLLNQIKKEKWETEEKQSGRKRGRKNREIKPMIDLDKPRNKGYNWLKEIK
jgi:hypothetical protein